MTAASAPIVDRVRGWCPTARRPMESGDGWLVRVRPRSGRFTISEIATLARLADHYGNGHIDLTRRANLQLRGIRLDIFDALTAELLAAGLIDQDADAEAVRNILVSPLGDFATPTARDAVRDVARELDNLLRHDRSLFRLPGKFAFVVDAEGIGALDGERADIRLRLHRDEARCDVAIETRSGVRTIGETAVDGAAQAAIDVARAFLSLSSDIRARMRDLDDRQLASLGTGGTGLRTTRRYDRPSPRAGIVWSANNTTAIAFAAPFGRVEACDLASLADGAAPLGVTEMRLSPWRSLIAIVPEAAATDLMKVAAHCNFIVNGDDPLLAVDACPGAPACRSTQLQTHDVARALAPLISTQNITSLHVSGCAKGCARSAAADVTIVGDGDCFGIVQHGRAQDLTSAALPLTALSRLPDILRFS